MSEFVRALQTKDARTENAMPTHSTSSQAIVDLFFKMGGSRAMTEAELESAFISAFGEHPLLATRAAFYNRDVRGGQGERRSFRIFLRYLALRQTEVARKNLHLVPEYGRWDDLFVLMDTPLRSDVLDLYAEALVSGDRLAAKWAPREGKRQHEIYQALRNYMDLSPREYRKLVVSITDVVENKMCENEWDDIDYNAVPSIAIKKYRKAWFRHDEKGYTAWLDELEKPEGESTAKINAGAIHPHEIVKPYLWGNPTNSELRQLQAQWDALPDYMPKDRRIIPVCDTSGSMYGYEALPISVSVALGLYLSERNEGPYHNAFITFSNQPRMQYLRGKTLEDRVKELSTADWAMNTNIEKTFNLILKKALDAGLTSSEMPEAILIISDMQFDQCTQGRDRTAMEMIEEKYRAAGYVRPQIIFWNVRTGSGVPVKFDKQGTALVSGFSPSIMRSIMVGKNITPLAIVEEVLNSERYQAVTV